MFGHPSRRTCLACRGAFALSLTLSGIGISHAQQTQGGTEPPQVPVFDQPGYGLPAFTQRISYFDLEGGAAYTDNALLTSENRQTTGIGTAGVDLDYDRVGTNLDINARGGVDWVQYFNNAYPGTPYGNFDGTALWGHATDLFQWVVRDTYTEGTATPLAAPTLSQTEGINFFTTGPYLNFNFSGTERVTLYGSYSDVTFQKSPYDSSTYDGGALYTHRLSPTSSVGLQIDSSQTTLQQADVAPNFAIRTAQLLYNGNFSRTEISASAGYTTENFGGPTSGAPLVSLELSRRISPSSTVYLSGRYEYATVGTAVRSDLAMPSGAANLTGVAPAYATPAPYKDRYLGIGWNFRRHRTSLSVTASTERYTYVQQSIYNNNTQTLSVAAQRQISPTVWLELQGYRTDGSYSSLVGHLTDTVVNLSLRKQFRRLGVTLYAQRTHQSTSAFGLAALGVATGTYSEDRMGLLFSYDVIGSRSSSALIEP